MKKVHIIGSGLSGLSSAAYLAKEGYDVTIIEKNEKIGGRLQSFSEKGFHFDMGPSWYWMPQVFEKFYNDFGFKTSDFYNLIRLDPSYRVFYKDEFIDVPPTLEKLYDLFESIDKGSSLRLKKFLKDAKIKYEISMNKYISKISNSVLEYINYDILTSFFKLNLFGNIKDEAVKVSKNPKLQQILTFPSLFLGSTPQKTPALYTMMNYADLELGTWYPMGGMNKIIDAFVKINDNLGVKFINKKPCEKITSKNNIANKIFAQDYYSETDGIIATGDYHHIEQCIFEKEKIRYNEKYWQERTLSPSCLLFYLGVNIKIENLLHHNLFFDEDFDIHSTEIYETKTWPKKPLVYICAPSKTDDSAAPKNHENLFVLIPISPGLKDEDSIHQYYFEYVINKIKQHTNTDITNHIVYKQKFSVSNFIETYNSFKGNAYGLANTLKQTAFLKPKMKTKYKNVLMAGQLTVPGPGMPPSIISGKIASNELIKILKNNK